MKKTPETSEKNRKVLAQVRDLLKENELAGAVVVVDMEGPDEDYTSYSFCVETQYTCARANKVGLEVDISDKQLVAQTATMFDNLTRCLIEMTVQMGKMANELFKLSGKGPAETHIPSGSLNFGQTGQA